MATSSQKLEKYLFMLNPTFRRSLLSVRQLCCGLTDGKESQYLCSVTSGKVYRLEEFVQAQQDQSDSMVAALKEFHTQSLANVKKACSDTISELEDRLFGEEAQDGQDEDPNSGQAGKVSYTVLAQRRAEHRKLHGFIRLIDYMIRSNLHQLVVASTEHLLTFIEQPRQIDSLDDIAMALEAEPEVEETEEQEEEQEELEATAEDAAGNEAPVFEIETQEDADSLCFSPSRHGVQRELEKLLASFTITVSSVPDLSAEKSLREFTALVEVEQASDDALASMVASDPHYIELVSSVRDNLDSTFELAEECKEILVPMLDLVRENQALDIEQVKAEANEGSKSLADFEDDMVMYSSQTKKIQKLPALVKLGVLLVNSEQLRDKFLPAPQKCLDELQTLLPQLGNDKVQVLLAEINDANTQLNKTPPDVDEFCDYLEFLEHLESRQDEIKDLFELAEEHYDLMDNQNVFVPPDQRANFQSLTIEYSNMKTWLSERQSKKDEDIQQYTVMLEASIKMLHEDRKVASNASNDEMFLEYTPNGMNLESDVMKRLTDLNNSAEEMKANADKIQRQQKLFNKHDTNSSGVVERFEELKLVVDDITLKKKLWDALREFTELKETWTKTNFVDLDAEDMSNEVSAYNKIVMNAERTLPTNNVVPVLKEMVTVFKNTVPVVSDLGNDGLQNRHWEKIEAVIGQPIPRQNADEFTFGTLIDLQVMLFKDQINIISMEATQEAILEQLLQNVSNAWADAEFVLLPYKDTKDVYVLSGIEDITLQLDDSLVTMGTITASRFVGGIRDKVEVLEQALNLFSETLDAALNLQRNWMYLDSIFCAQDIQRQLPAESKQFFDVDSIWKTALKNTKDTGNAFKSFTAPGMFIPVLIVSAWLRLSENHNVYCIANDTHRGCCRTAGNIGEG